MDMQNSFYNKQLLNLAHVTIVTVMPIIATKAVATATEATEATRLMGQWRGLAKKARIRLKR